MGMREKKVGLGKWERVFITTFTFASQPLVNYVMFIIIQLPAAGDRSVQPVLSQVPTVAHLHWLGPGATQGPGEARVYFRNRFLFILVLLYEGAICQSRISELGPGVSLVIGPRVCPHSAWERRSATDLAVSVCFLGGEKKI